MTWAASWPLKLSVWLSRTGRHSSTKNLMRQLEGQFSFVDRPCRVRQGGQHIVTGESRVLGQEICQVTAPTKNPDHGRYWNTRTRDARNAAHHAVVNGDSARHSTIIV